MAHISDIKLIRTDTTLDLSQKAEKGMLKYFKDCLFYSQVFGADSFSSPIWWLLATCAHPVESSEETSSFYTSWRLTADFFSD
ncbi:hypothetical protein JHK87_037465 [Glycine soja]|nr:hypothetical protein JHK87_037465 [Glycine soja]